MDLSLLYVTFGLLSFILLLLFQFYRDAREKVDGFPFCHIVPKIVYDQVTGKIPKDVPITSHAYKVLMDVCKKYSKEGLFMTYLSRPTLFIFGEEAMKFFFNEKAALERPPEYEIVQQTLGAGIGTSNGERWKTHRKLMNPAFYLGMVKNNVPLFNEHASALVKDIEELAEKSSVDLLDALKCNYFNELSESVLSLKQSEENKQENMRIFSMVDAGGAIIVKRLIFPWLRPKLMLHILPFGRKYHEQKKEFNQYITKMITRMKQQIESDKTMDTDHFSSHLKKSVAYILLNQHLNDPSFTFQDLHDEVSNVLVAGYDTVTYTTLWCLFLLGLHPEVQEKAFDEVQSTADSYITYEDCCNLTYLEAVIMETLRLYPVVPLIGRNLSEDVEYGKYKVHKGTTIFFLFPMSHRIPDIYPNPEKFEPERFLNSEPRRKWTFVPFSEGIKNCIGKKYAIIEMKIFLAYILRNFKITSLDEREDIHICMNVTLTPAKHMRLKITPRHKLN